MSLSLPLVLVHISDNLSPIVDCSFERPSNSLTRCKRMNIFTDSVYGSSDLDVLNCSTDRHKYMTSYNTCTLYSLSEDATSIERISRLKT